VAAWLRRRLTTLISDGAYRADSRVGAAADQQAGADHAPGEEAEETTAEALLTRDP
jgi:hypothetical protein